INNNASISTAPSNPDVAATFSPPYTQVRTPIEALPSPTNSDSESMRSDSPVLSDDNFSDDDNESGCFGEEITGIGVEIDREHIDPSVSSHVDGAANGPTEASGSVYRVQTNLPAWLRNHATCLV